jgi:hypothetical protein
MADSKSEAEDRDLDAQCTSLRSNPSHNVINQ